MNDNDELNDSAVLSAVRDGVLGLPLPGAPRLDAITARGRRVRRRRALGGLSAACAGACAVLAAGLAASPGSAGPAPRHDAPAADLAAFSVGTRPGGATTLTLSGRQVIDPGAVRRALAAHGIPALVTAGRFCRTAEQPSPGAGQVVVLPGRPLRPAGRVPRPGAGGPGPIVIYGSAIPRGVQLSIGYRQDPRDREISFSLIRAGAPLTCSSIPDSGPHAGG